MDTKHTFLRQHNNNPTRALTEEQLIEEIKDVHILGIRSKTQVTKKILDAAKKLQAIGCFCIGVNQVDLKSVAIKPGRIKSEAVAVEK